MNCRRGRTLGPVGDTRRPALEDPLLIEYDEAPLRPFHLRIAVASTGGVFSDGFGLGIIGIALSRAAPSLALSPVWMGLLGGASLFGLFAGALLTGPVADRFGRRPIFSYNMAVLGALSLLQGLIGSAVPLLLLRLAIGFLLGTDYVVSKALLTEFIPRRLRGRVLGFLSIAWAGGYACAYAVGFALGAADPDSWRWMLISSAVPCLLILPLRITMPESPLWLTNHGRREAAARVVHLKLGADVAPPLQMLEAPNRRGRWHQLLTPAWRRRTFVGCAFFTCQVIPYFALGTFVAQVMSAMNLKNGYLGGLIYNFSLLGGAIVGLIVVDRISRRDLLDRQLQHRGSQPVHLDRLVRCPGHSTDRSVRRICRRDIGGFEPLLRLSARALSDASARFGHRSCHRRQSYGICGEHVPAARDRRGVRSAYGIGGVRRRADNRRPHLLSLGSGDTACSTRRTRSDGGGGWHDAGGLNARAVGCTNAYD